MAVHAQKDLRDDIRRLLMIVPPVDSGGGVGVLPPNQPEPDNQTVNAAINWAISAINRLVRVGPWVDYALTVPKAPDWKRGVAWADVKTIEPPGLGVIHATEISDCSWTDDKGNVNRLEPEQYYSVTKNYTQFQPYKPGRPDQFIISGAQVGLLPAPSTPGTLRFTAATGMDALLADDDIPQYLPDDYVATITYIAVVILCARDAQDIEMQTRLIAFQPVAQQTLLQCYQWKNGYDDSGVEVVKNTLSMLTQNVTQQRLAIAGGGSSQGGQQ